jgi:dihydropteroate synthase
VADKPTWRLRTRHLTLDRPVLMGVLNVTPDSFSDGGRHATASAAIDHGRRLLAAGADIIDIGGESTRPGSEPVSIEIELARVLPVIEALADEGAVISVDTTKPEVASGAVAAGAEIVNDISAASAVGMADTMATTGVGVVLMHMQGTPRTMQDNPTYDDVVGEVRGHLVERAGRVEEAGVDRRAVMIDPGIGFGKTVDHNLTLLRRIGEFVATGYPVMVGASRKGFLGKVLDIDDAGARDLATAAVTALVVAAGAAAVRVHDAASSRQAALVAHAIGRSA